VLFVIYSSAEVAIVLFVGYCFNEAGRLCLMWGIDLLKWIYCVASDVNEPVFSCLIAYFACHLQHTNSRRCVTSYKEEC
jgi:hypothetical protein